jgi:hypothetical protein
MTTAASSRHPGPVLQPARNSILITVVHHCVAAHHPPQQPAGRIRAPVNVISAQFCARFRTSCAGMAAARGTQAFGEAPRFRPPASGDDTSAIVETGRGREQNLKNARHEQCPALRLSYIYMSSPRSRVSALCPVGICSSGRNQQNNPPGLVEVIRNVTTKRLRNPARALMRGRQGRGKAPCPWHLTLPTNIEPS